MTGRLATAAILLLHASAFAHRLDEYLQATIIEVEKDRVRADLTLTPGVGIAGLVIHSIDTDGDGIISAAEGQAYAARVLGDLTLTLDGRRLVLKVTSAQFPSVSEIREGRGEMQLGMTAALPRGGRERKVVLVNRHQSRIAAYEVNCLVTSDVRMRISAQKRNYSQSVYELDYEETDEPPARTSGLIWLTPVALFLAARFGLARRQQPISRYIHSLK